MVQLRNYKMHLTRLHHGEKRNAVTSVVLTFSPQINNINFRLALADVAAVPQSSSYGTAHPKTSSS